MAVSVEEMFVAKSWRMKLRCRLLELKIDRQIRRHWSPGKKVAFRVPGRLIDEYTMAEVQRRFTDWDIEWWGVRDSSRVFMRVSERQKIPVDQKPYR